MKKKYGNYSDQEKRIFVRTIKLAEELGELCNEVLIHGSVARKEKLANHDQKNLPDEFADVIITTLLLAMSMDVKIEKALGIKIKKINQRYKSSRG